MRCLHRQLKFIIFICFLFPWQQEYERKSRRRLFAVVARVYTVFTANLYMFLKLIDGHVKLDLLIADYTNNILIYILHVHINKCILSDGFYIRE